MEESDEGRRLLMQFSRELNGVHGKTRNYSSPLITIRGTTFRYYFTKKEVVKILNSNGTTELGFVESLYKFEEDLELYINTATKDSPFLQFTDWISQKSIKIVIRKGDIVPYRR